MLMMERKEFLFVLGRKKNWKREEKNVGEKKGFYLFSYYILIYAVRHSSALKKGAHGHLRLSLNLSLVCSSFHA